LTDEIVFIPFAQGEGEGPGSTPNEALGELSLEAHRYARENCGDGADEASMQVRIDDGQNCAGHEPEDGADVVGCGFIKGALKRQRRVSVRVRR
jgi:hypothetical protein